jgi:hypothetical protein
MRINAKGLHWTPVTLADGSKKTYWYAWRGGPRLTGEYGTPEFIASFNAAIATKVAVPEGRLLSLLQGYQQSQDFLALRERTRVDYIKQIEKIEQKFADAPIKALADPRTRGIFLDREIIMQPTAHLGPLEIIDSDIAEGRFVGLLPHEAPFGTQ